MSFQIFDLRNDESFWNSFLNVKSLQKFEFIPGKWCQNIQDLWLGLSTYIIRWFTKNLSTVLRSLKNILKNIYYCNLPLQLPPYRDQHHFPQTWVLPPLLLLRAANKISSKKILKYVVFSYWETINLEEFNVKVS